MLGSILKVVQGWVKIKGNTDGSFIGNVGDRLKTDVTFNQNDYISGSFGSLRVITTQNIFESLFSFDKQPLIWDEQVSGGGSATWNPNTKSIDMTVPTTNGASVVRQTFRRIRYNPSRTVQVLAAGVLGAPKTNVRKRIGQFDSLDGLFIETDGTTVNFVRRTSTSGSTVDVKTPQSSWNIDKFDGSGPSGVTIDFTKHHLFFSQYAFQGFGHIVYGFYIDSRIMYAHREKVANILSVPSMRTAHLPCRVEITNTGTSASPTTLSYTSFAVKNEGEDAEQEGQVLSYSSAPIKTVSTTVTPVLSVRLASGYERAIADIIRASVFVQTADEVIWSLHVNPTLTGATFAVSASYTVVDTAATAMTGGTEILSGILAQKDSSADLSSEILKFANSFLGSSIAGVNSIITLAARSRVGSADVLSTLVWREYP